MMQTERRRTRGFTLIELMITVMVLGILSAIAIPQYQQYVAKARRTEAKAALARVQGAQERYFTVNNKYETSPAALGLLACGATTTGSADTCNSSSYTITIAALAGNISTGYALSAAPVRADALCGTFTVDSLNNKDVSGGTASAAECW
ncbi:type IV pilin protein [Cupriavidus campinensis]